jgi:hypothetical protein
MPQFLKLGVQFFSDLYTMFHGMALALQSGLPWKSDGFVARAYSRCMACVNQPTGLGVESARAAKQGGV